MKTVGDFSNEKNIIFVNCQYYFCFLFSCSSNKFTVTWVNFDGTVLEIDKGSQER